MKLLRRVSYIFSSLLVIFVVSLFFLKPAYADQSSPVILSNNTSSQSASFQTINSALNYASSQNWDNITLQLNSSTFNEDVPIASNEAVTIVGQGNSSTKISGNLSFGDGDSIQLENLTADTPNLTSADNIGITVTNSTLSTSGNLIFGELDGITITNSTLSVSGNFSLGQLAGITITNSTLSPSGNLSFGDLDSITVTNSTLSPHGNLSFGENAGIKITGSTFSPTGNLTFGKLDGITISNSTLSPRDTLSFGDLTGITLTNSTHATSGNLLFGALASITITDSNLSTKYLEIGSQDSYTENNSTVTEYGGGAIIEDGNSIKLDSSSNLNFGCNLTVTNPQTVNIELNSNSHLTFPLGSKLNEVSNVTISGDGSSMTPTGSLVCYPNASIPKDYQQSHNNSSSSNNTINNGEPINMIGGNYLATRHEFNIPGRDLPVDFYLNYNSAVASQSSAVGFGWTHSYLVSASPIASGSGGIIINNEDGRMDLYTPDGSGGYTPPPDIHDTLKQTINGYILTRKTHDVYNFTAEGQLNSIVSPNGNTQILSYNSQKELSTLTDTVGRIYTFSYDSNKHLIQVTDPSNRSVKYTYDSNGNLSTATDPNGNVTTYHYDANHQITSITDPAGNVAVTNIYDTQNRVISQTNALGKTITLSYTPGKTGFTDQKGNTTTYFYDNQFRLTKVQNANGGVTSYTYDIHDNQNSITDPNGNITTMVFDTNGNLTQLTNALGKSAAFTYDTNNNLTSQTDPLGHVSNFSYDSHNNLQMKTDPAGNKTTYSFDSFGELISQTDSLGNTTNLTYDNQGNVIKITNPLGNASTITYDNISRPVSATDASGHTSQFVYDALDRLIQSKDALSNSISYVFDADGNRTKVTDPNGNITTYGYNPANELTTVIDALGHSTSYAYDPAGNLSSTTDANSHTTTYAYDVVNRLIATTNPLGQNTTRTYDLSGSLISSTDPKGQKTTYAYDQINQLTTISYADNMKVSYAFDANGNRTQMTDATGQTSYAYDILGNLTNVTTPDNKKIQYTYNADSEQTSMTYPDGNTEQYSYNKATQLVSAQDWHSHTTTYAYNPTGNIKQINYPNGATISYAYDTANRLTTVTNTPKIGPGTRYTYTLDATGDRTSVEKAFLVANVGNNQLQNILQSFPNLGNLFQNIFKNGQFSFSDPANTNFYIYDALNRLTKVKGQGSNQDYTYDPVGNRLSQVSDNQTTNYTYNPGDEMLKAGNISYSYDANGNRVQEKNNGSVNNFSYNDANKLISVAKNVHVQDQYVYDGNGNRVQTTTNNITTNDIWNVNGSMPQLLSQTTLNRTADYQYGTGLISSNNLQQNSQDYYEFDGLGSVVGQTNSQGVPISQYDYNAFGSTKNGQASGQLLQNPFGFAGQQQDPTGLMYMRARYYDPQNGVFLTRDPLVNLSKSNYGYVADNPINLTDPSGLLSLHLNDQRIRYVLGQLVPKALEKVPVVGKSLSYTYSIGPGVYDAFSSAGKFVAQGCLENYFYGDVACYNSLNNAHSASINSLIDISQAIINNPIVDAAKYVFYDDTNKLGNGDLPQRMYQGSNLPINLNYNGTNLQPAIGVSELQPTNNCPY